jgi:hypothetical protein
MGMNTILEAVDSENYVFLEDDRHRVAVLIHPDRLNRLLELEQDVRDLVVVADRLSNDSGRRVSLDEVIDTLGFTRAELEASEPDE